MSTSSKTPNSETAKTASAPKAHRQVRLREMLQGPRAFLYGLIALLAGAVIVVMGIMSLGGRAPGQTTLLSGTHRYALEVAVTPEAQEKGLGGRKTMTKDDGMLFLFAGEDKRCFWMKDMHFSLDIIWLNDAKEVVHIEPNVSPGSYPEDFCPNEPARYVIELRAGQARAAGIREGQTLTF